MKPIVIAMSIALLTALTLLPRVALAGGWSVVSLDQVPADVVAGEEITIGFRVLQHGQHPVAGLEAHIEAMHQESRRQIMFSASDSGTPGHYSATITLPEAGVWEWAVVAFEGPHVMYPLKAQPEKSLQGSLQGEPTLGHDAQLFPGFWDWMAIGSSIAAGVALLAMAGVVTGIPTLRVTRAR
jgi:hypothetical protein